ncbi:MAG TPA: ATP-binding cassette domain-containing protein [Gemmatimonadales bacterium]|nr:ATP-binding cassette domain-containing protein [Gemmatimonadales bacterium]
MHALRGVDFRLAPGEVHALLGENGAGKSTLMQVAYGLTRPDAGELRVDSVTRRVSTPRAARSLGIGMVHQHFTSVPALTVAENVALAAGWRVAPREIRERTRALSERIGLPLDPDQRAGRLSVSFKQRLEIVKALATEARILLLDEPTAVLALAEAEELMEMIRAFTLRGGSAVLITHKLDEALRAADRVTVLRQGTVTLMSSVSEQTVGSLASAMIGASAGSPFVVSKTTSSVKAETPREAIRFDALELSRESGYGIAIRHGSLSVQSGEIVGVAAVEGNGQRELLRAVAGRIVPLRGKLQVTQPVAFIPEDRTSEGLIPALSLTENVVLGLGKDGPWVRGGRIFWREAEARTKQLLTELDIVATGPGMHAAALSGGNQQKLIVARELSRNPAVIAAENPTRGLDISAAADIHARFRSAAEAGAAVLFHSADLDEVLELADRVVVVVRGVMTEAPPTASREEIGAMMLRSAPEA